MCLGTLLEVMQSRFLDGVKRKTQITGFVLTLGDLSGETKDISRLKWGNVELTTQFGLVLLKERLVMILSNDLEYILLRE